MAEGTHTLDRAAHLTIKTSGFRHDRNEAAALLILRSLSPLLPRWLETIALAETEPDNDKAAASTIVNVPYRNATIFIQPSFYAHDDDDRLSMLLHEIAHVVIQPIVDHADKTLETLLKDDAPKFHAAMEQERIERMEGVVCDLTRSMLPYAWSLYNAARGGG